MYVHVYHTDDKKEDDNKERVDEKIRGQRQSMGTMTMQTDSDKTFWTMTTQGDDDLDHGDHYSDSQDKVRGGSEEC